MFSSKNLEVLMFVMLSYVLIAFSIILDVLALQIVSNKFLVSALIENIRDLNLI